MTAYTSSGSGKASAAGTWGGGGTPSSNGDTFVVSSGHLVEWDLDTSGLANGLGASTINGTLYFSRTAGTYYLKMNGTLTVSTTGTLDASDGSGGAYPANCTATILLNGNFSITVSGNGAVNLICGEPTHKTVKLTQAESASATTLHVDTDVTGDVLWANGSLVRIDNINQAAQSEERTISSVTATTVVITSGLTASKAQGAYVILVSRNVKILGASTASGTAINGGTGGTIGAEIRNIATGISTTTSATISGTITGCTTAIITGTRHAISACISGCTTGLNSIGAFVLSGLLSSATTGISGVAGGSGGVITGIITGCTTAINSSGGHTVAGSIVNCGNGIVAGGGYRLIGATLNNNNQDLNVVGSLAACSTLFGSSIEFLNYNGARTLIDYAESNDHDQTAGAFRAWCKGGIVSSVSSPVFDASRPRSYNAVPESTSFPVFMQRQALVPAGGSVYVRCYVQKDASMSYLPRLQIFSAEKEPLLSGSPDAEIVMTNSTNTWEILEATVTNTTDAPKIYLVRCLAKNASGNVYFDPIIRTSALLIPADMDGLLAA